MYYVDPPHRDDKPTPLGTEEQREIWASEVLPLLPENYYDPIEFKDLELKLMEKGIEDLVSHEEYIAYTQTPEYEAEMERKREEEEQKKEEQERKAEEWKIKAEKIRKKFLSGEMSFSELCEQQLTGCLSIKEWRQVIESGELAKEIIRREKEDYADYGRDTWIALRTEFEGEKDWDELAKILSAKLKEEFRKKKQKILSGEIPLSEIDEYDLMSCFSCSVKEAQQIKKRIGER